jgi:hypothetical protein
MRAKEYQANASSRLQHTAYADSLQQQILQKQNIDKQDPYADRKALKQAATRAQIDESGSLHSSSGSYSIGGLRGLGGGEGGAGRRGQTSQATYAQQLQDQISAKQNGIGGGSDYDYNPNRKAYVRRTHSPAAEDSTSGLTRLGLGGNNKHNSSCSNGRVEDARKYAAQLQHQIATKKVLYNKHARNESDEGGTVYTDKHGNEVGNRKAVEKRRNRVAVDNKDPYDSFLG